MDDKTNRNELISALADGQLQGEEAARAVSAIAADRQALATWHAYHLVGDVLRSGAAAPATPAPVFLDRLSARLAQEPPPLAADEGVRVLPAARRAAPAANDGSFRWKLVAGLASFAAVAAVGWTVLGVAPGAGVTQPQLAAAPATAGPAATEAPDATALARVGPGVMIRDPKLDELLAAHRQFGGASALQMPAGFVRSATFEAPAR